MRPLTLPDFCVENVGLELTACLAYEVLADLLHAANKGAVSGVRGDELIMGPVSSRLLVMELHYLAVQELWHANVFAALGTGAPSGAPEARTVLAHASLVSTRQPWPAPPRIASSGAGALQKNVIPAPRRLAASDVDELLRPRLATAMSAPSTVPRHICLVTDVGRRPLDRVAPRGRLTFALQVVRALRDLTARSSGWSAIVVVLPWDGKRRTATVATQGNRGAV